MKVSLEVEALDKVIVEVLRDAIRTSAGATMQSPHLEDWINAAEFWRCANYVIRYFGGTPETFEEFKPAIPKRREKK